MVLNTGVILSLALNLVLMYFLLVNLGIGLTLLGNGDILGAGGGVTTLSCDMVIGVWYLGGATLLYTWCFLWFNVDCRRRYVVFLVSWLWIWNVVFVWCGKCVQCRWCNGVCVWL